MHTTRCTLAATQPFDATRQQLPLLAYCKKLRRDVSNMSAPPPLPPDMLADLHIRRAGKALFHQATEQLDGGGGGADPDNF
jgi:hypothetical protein